MGQRRIPWCLTIPILIVLVTCLAIPHVCIVQGKAADSQYKQKSSFDDTSKETLDEQVQIHAPNDDAYGDGGEDSGDLEDADDDGDEKDSGDELVGHENESLDDGKDDENRESQDDLEEDSTRNPSPVVVGAFSVATVGVATVVAENSVSSFSGYWRFWLKKHSVMFGVLFERLRDRGVRGNKTREKILEYLVEHPGAHVREIMRDIGLGPNRAGYHL